MRKELVAKSRFLSLILRHQPWKAGIILDKNGWVDIEELLEKTETTIDELNEIVETNDKKRFTIEGDKIRAAQGHSVSVDLDLKAVRPPDVLYHGTKVDFISSITKNGLIPMSRTHVHLSENFSTATDVAGRRKGKSVILGVNTAKMHADGKKFYQAENGVWLTDKVETKYLYTVKEEDK